MQKVILVTGISGSGKTHYADAFGSPVLHFDEIHDYDVDETDHARVTAWREENAASPILVVDAWVLHLDTNLEKFRLLCGVSEENFEIHVVYTTHMELYLGQLRKEQDGHYKLTDDQRGLAKHGDVWTTKTGNFARRIQGFSDAGLRVRWFFRHDGTFTEYPNSEHIVKVLATDPATEFLAWVDERLSDKLYQTIELDGKIIREGYTESEKSWDTIAGWGDAVRKESLQVDVNYRLDWSGKSVRDIGCYLGFFCFRAERAGAAAVAGFDHSQPGLDVATRLAEMQGSNCRFEKKEFPADTITEKVDVCLVMNVLHHIVPDCDTPEAAAFLGNVFEHSNEVIFEIERNTEAAVTASAKASGFLLANEAESHRVTTTGVRRLLRFVQSHSALRKHWRECHAASDEQMLSGSPPAYVLGIHEIVVPQGGTVLDIGIGLGEMARYLKEQGCHVHSMDITEEALDKVADVTEARWLITDTLPAGMFDLAICHLVAQHVSDDDLVPELRNVLQSLKPGAVLSIQFAMRPDAVGQVHELIDCRLGGACRDSERARRIVEQAGGEVAYKTQPITKGVTWWYILHCKAREQ